MGGKWKIGNVERWVNGVRGKYCFYVLVVYIEDVCYLFKMFGGGGGG